MTARYLSTLHFADEWLDELRARVPEALVRQIPAEKPSDVPAEIWADTDVLHTSAVLPDPAQAPALRWVQLDTSGVDHVVETPLWRSDVAITTIGGVSPVPLAEYVIFTVLGFAHRLPVLLETRATRRWPSADERWAQMLPRPLAGATIGIVGYGRIGREIGRRAQGHGMHVIGVSRTGTLPDAATRAGQVDFGRAAGMDAAELVGPDRLHETLSRSDFVVVVVPLTDGTRGLIDRAAIGSIKPGAVLINVARGGIVDEAALRDALRRGALSGAALDVFDDEPLPPDSPWWDEPNVLVTPHVSGLAPRYADQVLDIVSENLRRFVSGEPLLNLVDRKRGY